MDALRAMSVFVSTIAIRAKALLSAIGSIFTVMAIALAKSHMTRTKAPNYSSP